MNIVNTSSNFSRPKQPIMDSQQLLDLMRGHNKAHHTYLTEFAIYHLGHNPHNESFHYTLHPQANTMLHFLSETIEVEHCYIIRIFLRTLVIKELTKLIFTREYDKDVAFRAMIRCNLLKQQYLLTDSIAA